MTSLMARLETARQVPASPPTPADTDDASSLAPAEATGPAQEDDVMSYLLNPPLPTQVEDAREETEPIEPAATAPPIPSGVRRSRGATAPRHARPTKKNTEPPTMQTPTLVHARVPNTENGAAHPSRGPDPESCLSWLDFLAKSVHPGALHLLLAYYRRLGWIPSGHHTWLRDVCDGIARQNRNMTWDSLRITPEELIKVHTESHRWLSAMFPPAKAFAALPIAGDGALRVKKAAPRRN